MFFVKRMFSAEDHLRNMNARISRLSTHLVASRQRDKQTKRALFRLISRKNKYTRYLGLA